MEKFKLGFTVGRFQLVHKGHEQLIDFGLEMCEKFVVLVGSAQESRTKDNPFTFEERKEMLQTIYGDKIIILPIVDIGVGYKPEWGKYLINTIKFNVGEEPKFAIVGSELGREDWLPQYHGMSVFTVSRDIIKTSGTECREYLLKNGSSSYISEKYKQSQLKRWQEIIKETIKRY